MVNHDPRIRLASKRKPQERTQSDVAWEFKAAVQTGRTRVARCEAQCGRSVSITDPPKACDTYFEANNVDQYVS